MPCFADIKKADDLWRKLALTKDWGKMTHRPFDVNRRENLKQCVGMRKNAQVILTNDREYEQKFNDFYTQQIYLRHQGAYKSNCSVEYPLVH